jgi:hypothetical protein
MGQSYQVWTPREEQFLRDNWHKTSRAEISRFLRRPANQISNKAKQLGLVGKRS